MTVVGFTGTRNGMVDYQAYSFENLIRMIKPTEFHHGDCVGADAHAHNLVRIYDLKIRITGHPPNDPRRRAYMQCDVLREEKTYLERNHDIVDESDIIIACPKSSKEEQRSGTWATVRYAEKMGKEVYLISPTMIWRWKNGRRESIRQS